MKVLAWLIVLAAIIVLLAIAAEFMKRSSLFFPDRYPVGLWDFSSLPVRPAEQWIETPDHVRLHALWFDAGSAAPAMIWFHGNAGNVSNRAPIAAVLAKHGVSVLLFDYRGYGRSGGSPTEDGLATDSVAAFDYLVSRLRPASVVLYGESLGGAYAAWVSAHRRAACVVIQSSFASLARLARHYYPGTPFPFFVSRSLRTQDWLNAGGVPVLVIHGREDEVIPYKLGLELFDGLTVPKELYAVPGAMHNDVPDVAGEEYYARIASFARR